MDNPNTVPEHGDGVDEVWFDTSDGRWWGSDDHGEFPLHAGSPHPVEKGSWNEFKEREITYHPCSRVLKFTFDRYGERRFCTGIAYVEGQTCKHHKARLDMEEQVQENFKTGAHTESHDAIFKYLPPHKKILANELYKSLLDESIYSFEETHENIEIDTSEWEQFGSKEIVVIKHPVPSEHKFRGEALWFAALDFVVMQNIREEQFRVAHEEGIAIGEKEFEREAESGQVYTVIDEHHLNLDLSRIQRNYKEHLKIGGVQIEDEGRETSGTERDWVIEVVPEDEEVVEVETPKNADTD